MRLIFLLLLLINALLLFWRFGLGLPERYHQSGSDRAEAIASGQSLRLLSEPPLKADTELKASPQAPLCKMVGPFESNEAAAVVLERLAALDVSAQVHHLELSAGKGYWVHFPAGSNRAEARKQLAQLQSRGIDSYMIPSGELKNGISLGVFSQKRLADARVAELKAMDYEPQVRIIDRSYQEVWVALDEGEELKIAKSAWKTLTQETFSLQEQENVCLDVASH